MQIAVAQLASPIGPLQVCATDAGLCALSFGDEPWRDAVIARRFGELTLVRGEDPHGACSALAAYFRGEIDALDALPVDLGGTPFQRDVWAALRRVRAGRTSTYGQLAAEVGRPSAVRAVGAANGQNPVALVVPCHRIIATGGKLQGYGGGLERKRWLLVHERALLA
jgi:methylated-DNA-[protein]-cysteine S-methyltransferase